MLSTITPPFPGAICRTMIVSDRSPVTPAPNPRVPALLSDPMTRMFRAFVSFGGCGPSPATDTRLMLSQTARNFR